MNDFAKDELIELWEYCNWKPPAPGHSDFRQNLWLKLESMIDNYCEPDWDNTGCGCLIEYNKCTKCGFQLSHPEELETIMNDFKSGDTVWFFTTCNPDPKIGCEELWSGFDIEKIFIDSEIYDEDDDFPYPYTIYRSKQEALEAIISRFSA